MAAAPRFKVYTPQGEYTAACKQIEEAACLVAFLGDGATIRPDHGKPAWVEGREDQPAGESYDHVVYVVTYRMDEARKLARVKGR